MADGYLEKRYEEVFGKGAKKTVVKHTSIETIMEKNRSYRGYDQDFVVKRDMLERIVAVNTKIASAKNQQVLRFKLVTKASGDLGTVGVERRQALGDFVAVDELLALQGLGQHRQGSGGFSRSVTT